ncbi:MAG TPA: hypothetical protein DDY16_05450 [Tenacibaculum sp.]|nr:hypothetical protein [Tenacibaculum sp.]
MTPDYFKYFLVNSEFSRQQEIVSSLLAISTEPLSLIEPKEDIVITYTCCQGFRIRTNGKLRGV